MKKITLLVILFVSTKFFVYGQTSASHTIKIVANPILELKFDENYNNTEFNFQTISDYDNGKTNLQAKGLKVKSNKNWIVSVKASTSTFTALGTGNEDMQSKVLYVRKSGTENTIAIDTFEQAIASGTHGGFDKNNFILDYITKPGYIKPDAYSLEITYTLTTP